MDADDVVVLREAGLRGPHPADRWRPEGGAARLRRRHRARAPRRSACWRASTSAAVRAYPRPRVGVMSTGDELVESGPARRRPDPRLEPPDAARARRRCGLRARRPRHRPRRRAVHRRPPSSAGLETCDAILTSGGVSMGDYDFVKSGSAGSPRSAPGSSSSGGRWRSSRRSRWCSAPSVGSRSSASRATRCRRSVSFELFARPALRTMMGHRDPFRPVVVAVADHPMPRKADGKVYLERVRVRYDDGRYRRLALGRPVEQRAVGHGGGQRVDAPARRRRGRGRRRRARHAPDLRSTVPEKHCRPRRHCALRHSAWQSAGRPIAMYHSECHHAHTSLSRRAGGSSQGG